MYGEAEENIDQGTFVRMCDVTHLTTQGSVANGKAN